MPRVTGKHITLDMYGVDKKRLRDYERVYNLLDKMPDKIGMRKLTTPYVVTCKSERTKDSGISGFVMIYESHISCHTWPEKGCVSMDVYSCNDFDEKKVTRFFKRVWRPKQTKVNLIIRG